MPAIGYLVLVERLDHLGEVEERTAEAVDLVNHDAVDLARLDIRQQAFQRRPFHIAAGEPAVVVLVRKALPTFARLRLDVVLARLALGIERVKFLLQPLFR